jgi:hypothetical protein
LYGDSLEELVRNKQLRKMGEIEIEKAGGMENSLGLSSEW